MIQLVNGAEPDLQAPTPSLDVNIQAFLDREAAFGPVEAEELVTEASVLGPTLMIDPIVVLALRKGFKRKPRSILPYRHLRAFFALGSDRIDAQMAAPENDDRLDTIVLGIIKDVAIILAEDSPSTAPAPNPSMWANLFKSVVSMMEALLDYNRRHMAAIEDANGPQAVGDSLESIAATFARRSDVDSCKMWIDQMARYMAIAGVARDEDIGKQLEKLVEVLKTLQLDIK